MPPKCRFTREQIIQAALELTAEKGIGALTARSLAQRLGSSAKPIFGLFTNMEEVQQEVLKAADQRYGQSIAQAMEAGKYPPYKASGMAYIAFAQQEKPLFRLLFMRDRTNEEKAAGEELEALLSLIRQNMGLSREEAYRFHMEMWIYVHGIATMIATAYLEWDLDFISAALTDAYQGLRLRFGQTGQTGPTETKQKKE